MRLGHPCFQSRLVLRDFEETTKCSDEEEEQEVEDEVVIRTAITTMETSQ